jgi:hypothetical protein
MASFAETYPHITEWVESWGWIEIGNDGNTDTFVRALDEGGQVWASATKYKSLDEALQSLDEGLAEWMDSVS